MEKMKVAIVGFGNIGSAVYQAIIASDDMECAGVVVRNTEREYGLTDKTQIVTDIKDLGHVDVAILGVPSRSVPEYAKNLLSMGINTVDSYDIHGNIYDVKSELDLVAKANGAAAIISAGWDPGSDSVIRALLLAISPKGITYTNFGPGMSMGHTVAVKAIDGVKNALSMTMPVGAGVHRRMVYIEINEGCDFSVISQAIKNDPYFVHDDTHVMLVDDVDKVIDMGHGVHIERKGVSGTTHNQNFEFNMKINNPALTAQVLVACARGAVRQNPGAYTMIEIPVIDMIAGDREKIIRGLV